MKRATIWLALLTSCATAYRDSYQDAKLGPMRHSIDVQVNGWTSAGAALQYAHRRAAELCPDGYDVVDESQGARKSYYVSNSTVNEIDKPEVAIIVQCKEQVPTMRRDGPPGQDL